MKKNILIFLTILLNVNLCFSQTESKTDLLLNSISKGDNHKEIHAVYKFKKVKSKSRFLIGIRMSYIELDSLVLYKNGTFYRKRFYHYHELILTEYVGIWKRENDTMNLKSTKLNTDFEEKLWFDSEEQFVFKIKKREIIPLSGYDKHNNRKLKLNENR